MQQIFICLNHGQNVVLVSKNEVNYILHHLVTLYAENVIELF